jgi:glycerol-3-phosphate acyltransferase PlsX
MEDDHYTVKSEKAGASMVVAMKLVAAGEGDAAVTAGNTGAAITAATLYIKRIRGIRRAALAPILPLGKNGVILIDCGANIECTTEYLLQFAYMGSIYAQQMFGNKSPTVGLLNIGAEHTKGDVLRRETYALLTQAKLEGRINFIGNVEGRDVPFGAADVVVTDGFSGNVLLKSMEGIGLFFAGELKKAMTSNLRGKIGGLLVKDNLSEIKKKMNYREIGGSPLVGIAAPVIKAHGSVDSFAVKNAILQAKKYAEGHIVDIISENIEHMKTSL